MKIKIYKQFTRCFSKFDNQIQGLILKTILGIKNDSDSSGMRLHKVGEYYSYSINMNVRMLYQYISLDESIDFVCDKCLKAKVVKKYAEYENKNHEVKRICNSCYSNVCQGK